MKIRWKVLSIVVFLIRADAEIVNWHAEWSPRSGHALVVFEDKMLLMGGITSNGLVNDVWSSRDGITWSIEATEAEWAPRQDHKVVSFDGNLYLVGGFSTLSTGADVWKSKDGKSWTRILEDAPWGVRAWHECVSFKKKLWLIGGMSASSEEKISGASLSSPTLTNDVWNSSDGIVWTCVSEAVVWSPRFR
ncbi:MAG: hypothetical protein HYV26_07670, partial [Candidatus Hydrogenedentes bacterium]|nr:hypothetical protein [Candidatus Hydrogenedentota bacterium]